MVRRAREMTFDSDTIKKIRPPLPSYEKIVEEETREHKLAQEIVDKVIQTVKVNLLQINNKRISRYNISKCPS